MNRRKFLKKAAVVSAAVVLLLASSLTQAADSAGPVTVLITYHSISGNTEKMAQGVAEGAKAVPALDSLRNNRQYRPTRRRWRQQDIHGLYPRQCTRPVGCFANLGFMETSALAKFVRGI